MNDFKKAVSTEGGSEGKDARLSSVPETESINYKGIACDALIEPIPRFISAPSETIINGANNSWIVLGRDRPRSRISGYGGMGDTQCGSIDIVTGRMGSRAREFLDDQRVWVDNDVTTDAARIYISQKTDIDENYNLVDGTVGNSKAKSGIALKADAIRIVAREGIKLVTRTDKFNSQGGEVASSSGIDLIANNEDEDLQPLVKGGNLIDALKRLTTHVSKLNGIVDSLLMYQINLNEALIHHTHYGPMNIISAGPGFVWETTPSMPVVSAGIKTMTDHLSQTKRSLMVQKANLGLYQISYLSPAGCKYINSRYNNVT